MITTTLVNQMTITGVEGFDPVRVIWEDVAPGSGRLTIMTYGRAWTGFWSAMHAELREFIPKCTVHYIRRHMLNGQPRRLKRDQQTDDAYLDSIIVVVQRAMKLHLHEQQQKETERRAA